jgi:hypothetical protein
MNSKDYNVNFSLDIALHVLILFTFLTIFFFAYISKLEKQNLDNVTNNVIIEKSDSILNAADDWQNNLNNWNKNFNIKIDWKTVDCIANRLIEESNGESPKIKENNDNLFKGSIIAICVAFFLFIGLVLFLKYYMKYDIHVKHILIMNLIIFSLTGLIEFLFFQNVASKYIPVTPDFTSNTVLERIKTNI